MTPPKSTATVQHVGQITPVDAANAIRAARLNALDLLDTAELLFTLKRFAHSMAFATLAIEEASKLEILLVILCAEPNDYSRLWKSYRNHRAKTRVLNKAIESRIRVTFPNMPRERAAKLGEAGPTPEQLEHNKQYAIYSDCVSESGAFVAHSPQLVEWRQLAWDRLCEAQALVHALRDRQPGELAIIQKHFNQKPAGSDRSVIMRALHDELLKNGFVKEGWWDTLLKDLEEDVRSETSPTIAGTESEKAQATEVADSTAGEPPGGAGRDKEQ